jgi:hypothetical protein
MKLSERIKKNQNYIVNILVQGGLNIVRVAYPSDWVIIPDEKGIINITNDQESGGIFYYGSLDNVSLDDIIDHIEETIQTNNEIAQKKELLDSKIAELRAIFDANAYEDLLTLKFICGDKQAKKAPAKKKRTKTPKPKVEEKETENLS